MNTYLDCIPCFVHQALRAGQMATSDEEKLKEILDRTGEMIKTISLQSTPAETGAMVYKIVSEVSGVADPYKKNQRTTYCRSKINLPGTGSHG